MGLCGMARLMQQLSACARVGVCGGQVGHSPRVGGWSWASGEWATVGAGGCGGGRWWALGSSHRNPTRTPRPPRVGPICRYPRQFCDTFEGGDKRF